MIKFIFFIFTTLLYADIQTDFLNKKYSKVCTLKNIYKYKNNDKALSIIGKACLNIDSIYLLPRISKFLIHTKEGRANSLYFLTVVLQKRLIYNYIFDELPLDSFNLPMTDYLLSYIFYKIKNNQFSKKKDKVIVKKGNITYFIYKKKDKMFVDEYINNKFIKQRWYR